MNVLAAAVLAFVPAPQVPPNLRLPEPPPPQRQGKEAVQRPVAEVERFRRELELLHGNGPEVERTLQRLPQDYPDVAALILQAMPAALARDLQALMVAARRFGTPKVADEILFQLLARPVGDATRDMIETLVALQGAASKKSLRDLIRGRISGARRIATEVLARVAGEDDLDFALELVDHQMLDLRLCGVELLGAIPAEKGRERLVRLLARDPTIAGAACTQLQRIGTAAQPVLLRVLGEPAIDRSFAYAAFALAAMDQDGTSLPPVATAPVLQQQLQGSDSLSRALAAVALGDMCFYGQAGAIGDADIVDGLLEIVAPVAFVPNFELLRRPAEHALQLLTGRTGTENVVWRAWWKDARANFAGLRARIDVAAADLGFATVELQGEQRHVRLVGEMLADNAPVPGALEYVLDAESMQKVLAGLQAGGFMKPGAIVSPPGLPLVRTLQLFVRNARTMVAAPAALPEFDALVATIERAAEKELWQQLRHPVEEPERGAFWRAERRFQKSQTDPLVLDRRAVQRAIRVWPVASPTQRALVLAWWLQLPRRNELLAEADGMALLEIVKKAGELSEQDNLLLELAAGAPGDRVWREAIDVAARATGGGRPVIDRLFRVLGGDRVLQALGDERASVRRAAIDEVVEVRDMRASDRLLAMFADPEVGVRRAAVYASGQLALPAARPVLVELIVANDTDPVLRRDALAALGRVGGEGAFAVLQRALESPESADREAAMRGLGELQDSRAAALLAQIFAGSLGSVTGELARTFLQRMGSALAVPALRQQLATESETVRREIVLLLGGYFDPQVIPDLTDMLQRRQDSLLVAALLSSTTGLDLDSVADPVLALRDWWRDHRQEAQWRWLLQALERDQVKTSLDAAQFAAGAGLVPVPELARLMVEAEPGRLRALASAVLRSVSGEDFGQLTAATPVEVRQAIAARYRDLYESRRAAQGR